MAKTESTAVNELIALVSGQGTGPEPGEDLFSSSPKPMTAARMTAPLPIIKDAVPPLPRSRAPSGTQSNALPAVRASTAPPSRGSTIPPLPALKQPTQRMTALPPPPGGFRMTQSRPSLPPPMRHSQQRPAEGTPAPELFARTKSPTPAPASMPIAAPFEPRVDDNPFSAQPLPPVEHQKIDDSWFQSSYLVDKVELTPTPKSGTYQVPRAASTVTLIKKLVVPTAILVLVGVCIGGYLAFNGEGGHARKPDAPVATAPVAAPSEVKTDVAPKAEVAAKADDMKTDTTAPKTEAVKTDVAAKTETPAAKPDASPAKPDAKANVAAAVPAKADSNGMTTIKTTRGEVKLVDVLVDSKPSGATVMLVDRGKTSFLGNTPVSAAIDPSRAYDVVFSAANHSTQVEHLDPNVTHHLAITLGKPGNQVVAETHHHHHNTPAPAPAPAKLDAKVVAPAAKPEAKEVAKVVAPAARPEAKEVAKVETAKVDKPAKTEKVAAKVEAPALAAAPSGTGTLMVSSKPPCEIVIDGKPTGLTTPQRSIPLAPGAHKVTFVNAGESINKTVSVVINADKPTKLIQDLMKK